MDEPGVVSPQTFARFEHDIRCKIGNLVGPLISLRRDCTATVSRLINAMSQSTPFTSALVTVPLLRAA